MNKLTKLTGVVALSTLMATSAMAQTPNVMVTPADSTTTSITASNADLDFAFASTDELEVTGMDAQEMQDTQGAFVPAYYLAVYGVPAAFAAGRWAVSPGPQILYHRLTNR